MSNRQRSTIGVSTGAVIALVIPVIDLIVAFAWDRGVIAPDPNGAVIQALQSAAAWELVLGPTGIVIAAWSGGVAGVLRWTAVLIWTLPALAILWFVAVAWLGGLAGEPF